jgi:hypothetical protein
LIFFRYLLCLLNFSVFSIVMYQFLTLPCLFYLCCFAVIVSLFFNRWLVFGLCMRFEKFSLKFGCWVNFESRFCSFLSSKYFLFRCVFVDVSRMKVESVVAVVLSGLTFIRGFSVW